MNQIIDAIEKEQYKSDVTPFSVGDSVRVHTRVVEGDKERVQIFSGIVIGRKGQGLNEHSPCAESPTEKALSVYFHCIHRALQRWKWSKKVARVAPD